ncbi:tubulin/FtsZ family protein [Candidatus Hecatella orcuttiae]|uniref:tubulin/FtsZ family protein n=1 Tax=Candidatus Hecatella orcuttiae TaxID=1935119 RepID=UPI002867E879|nr:tubulin/FtsZ family protein [Candidatus Hecatella orcuttiae]
MKLVTIGLGQAGGRIVDLLLHYDTWGRHKHIVASCMAVNTSKSDLIGLRTIPQKHRVLIGQSAVKGHGVGLNNELAAKIMEKDHPMIKRVLSEREHLDIDAFLLIAGLGGGTGSGGTPVLVKALKESYGEPVYVLGVLPSDDEGGLMCYNAARSLVSLKDKADGIILFDNNLWRREGLPIQASYDAMNHQVVKPLPVLMGAGEVTAKDKIGAKVVDASDIMNTIRQFTVLGHSEVQLGGLWSKKVDIHELIRLAVTGKLTAECDIKQARRVLFMVAGPPREMSRAGIDHARSWLESVAVNAELRVGDYPLPKSKTMMSIVLFSGMEDTPRVKALVKKALEYQKLQETREAGVSSLELGKGRLKPLIE